MTAFATKMIPEIATKVKIGTAACAIAAATVLTPATVAQADPAVPVPTVGLGSAANISDCPAGAPDCDGPQADGLLPTTPSIGATTIAADNGPRSIIQNRFIWIGPANPNPPPRSDIFVFTPLTLVPGFLKPLWGFFTQHLNFEVCIGGLSARVGPYGSVSASLGSSC